MKSKYLIGNNCLLILMAFQVLSVSVFGQKAPYSTNEILNTPRIFAPGVICTPMDELNACFSPDGKTIFFSLNAIGNKLGIIMMSEFRKGKWTTPVKAPFSSGKYTDYDPFISPDGTKLFFISNRPVPERKDKGMNFDIYIVEKVNGKWSSEAKNAGPVINNEKNQFYPSVAANGNLYFSSVADSSYDIFCSSFSKGQYQPPVKLKGSINTKNGEVDNCISPDEAFIVFAGYNRKEGRGSGDIYISFNINGEWTEGLNLGDDINTKAWEYCPILSPDGQYLFFTSMKTPLDNEIEKPFQTYAEIKNVFNGIYNGSGNIYQVRFDKGIVEEWRKKAIKI